MLLFHWFWDYLYEYMQIYNICSIRFFFQKKEKQNQALRIVHRTSRSSHAAMEALIRFPSNSWSSLIVSTVAAWIDDMCNDVRNGTYFLHSVYLSPILDVCAMTCFDDILAWCMCFGTNDFNASTFTVIRNETIAMDIAARTKTRQVIGAIASRPRSARVGGNWLTTTRLHQDLQTLGAPGSSKSRGKIASQQRCASPLTNWGRILLIEGESFGVRQQRYTYSHTLICSY